MNEEELLSRLRAQVSPWRAGKYMPSSINDLKDALELIDTLRATINSLKFSADLYERQMLEYAVKINEMRQENAVLALCVRGGSYPGDPGSKPEQPG